MVYEVQACCKCRWSPVPKHSLNLALHLRHMQYPGRSWVSFHGMHLGTPAFKTSKETGDDGTKDGRHCLSPRCRKEKDIHRNPIKWCHSSKSPQPPIWRLLTGWRHAYHLPPILNCIGSSAAKNKFSWYYPTSGGCVSADSSDRFVPVMFEICW